MSKKRLSLRMLAPLALVAAVIGGLVLQQRHAGGVIRAQLSVQECVGKPYGTPGCPVIPSSSAPFSLTPNCGNAVINAGEECDDGRFNGVTDCTTQCTLLYCGDGVVSKGNGEDCEPESIEVYGLTPQGQLRVDKTYIQPACGQVCIAPSCDQNQNCNYAQACKWKFQPACSTGAPLTSSSGNMQMMAQGGEADTPAIVCGNNVLEAGEQCDDGNTQGGDGCNAKCATEKGFLCFGSPSICTSKCGDGLVMGNEQCDDGNTFNIDGCTSFCRTEYGYSCSGSPSSCKAACGDGVPVGEEQCDDGGTKAGDGCDASCKGEKGYTCTGTPSVCRTNCGDTHMAGNEQCDDGNPINGDGCSATCVLERGYSCTGSPSICQMKCGDGVIDPGEKCDDQNLTDGDGCSVQCQLETGYVCSGKPSECTTACGDGIKAGNEQCDDDNMTPGDGCSAQCFLEKGYTCTGTPSFCETVCGDGIVAGDEMCDQGRQNSDTIGGRCRLDCSSARCGDGIQDEDEECDDGNRISTDSCTNTCREPRCGDGLLQVGEQCDTGRRLSNTEADACRSTCKIASCGDGVKDTGEQCDGGAECSTVCTSATAAAPEKPVTPLSLPRNALIAGGMGMLAVLLYAAHKGYLLWFKPKGSPKSIDELPLNEIEQSDWWHDKK